MNHTKRTHKEKEKKKKRENTERVRAPLSNHFSAEMKAMGGERIRGGKNGQGKPRGGLVGGGGFFAAQRNKNESTENVQRLRKEKEKGLKHKTGGGFGGKSQLRSGKRTSSGNSPFFSTKRRK